MNKVILCGRLTKDPEVRYSSGDKQTAIARYNLAVDRRFKSQGEEQTADFINCVVFGRGAEFAETGSYINKDGKRVYTTDVVVENQEFAESKAASNNSYKKENGYKPEPAQAADGFMNIPDAIEDELPFKVN